MLELGEPVLVPAQTAPELELLPFHAAVIQPRLASAMMGVLTEAAPLEGLKHVKRVRKVQEAGKPAQLEIILCPAATADAVADMPEPICRVLEEHGLTQIKLIHAARHPPATREQWAAWTQHWPLYFNAPSTRGSEAEAPLQAEEAAVAQRWMRAALQAAEQGPGSNTALIVDPATDALVATGRDCSAESPLGHAVMTAVGAAAAENLRRWPPDPAAAACQPDCKHGAEKRQRLAGARDVSHGASPERPAEAEAETEPPPRAAPATERQYLCTGFDCYVVREPCAMCAMALVHSRLRRVFFCRPDAAHGALGGSFRLHAERSLNHHYAVYRLPPL